MYNIVIISASVRTGRNSHRVAHYLKDYVDGAGHGNAEILDLFNYQFPLFSERLQYLKNPPDNVVQFAEKIKAADGVIVVTPEYNGGYPAALKNVVDLLYAEWKRKPIGIAAVSAGNFGGTQVVTSLSFTFLKIGALVVPSFYHVSAVQKTHDETGVPADKEPTDKRATAFVEEFMWWVKARQAMEQS